jgi:hypothetical protein
MQGSSVISNFCEYKHGFLSYPLHLKCLLGLTFFQ